MHPRTLKPTVMLILRKASIFWVILAHAITYAKDENKNDVTNRFEKY